MAQRRGQIVLVAAFGLALVFVTLALLLNTAIFTGHLATQETTDATDAADFQDSVVETGGVLLWETNRDETTEVALASTYRDRVVNYSEAEQAHGIAAGEYRTVTLRALHNGTRVTQATTGPLESPTGAGTWQLADDVSAARAVALNVSSVDAGHPLVINATNGSATWELRIAAAGAALDVAVTRANGTTRTRTVAAPLHVEPTNGSIDGAEWPPLQFQTQVDDSWAIWIANGTNATGEYRFVLDQPDATIAWADGSNPGHQPTLFNATLGLLLERDELDYRANVTVAPDRRPG
jgi:hypothetical protein